MKRFTERMSFTVPVEAKRRWQANAAALGILLGEYVRRATQKMIEAEGSKTTS